MKCKDFKNGEIYLFERTEDDYGIYVLEVISEGDTYFRTKDLNILKGKWSMSPDLLRGFDNDSLKKFKVKKINPKEYPEYFI